MVASIILFAAVAGARSTKRIFLLYRFHAQVCEMIAAQQCLL